MIRFIFSLILFLFCSSIEGAHSPQDSIEFCQQKISQEIVSYAREYRKNTMLPSEEEILRGKNILEQVFDRLIKYDEQNSLENAVQGFVADELSTNVYDYTIIDASLTDIGGKSDDLVFLIKDKSDELCYVVKAFRSPRAISSKFLPEISALNFIQQLSIPGVEPITPIAFASYSNQDEEWGLLLETAAKGQRIDQIVYKLGNLEPASKERESFLTVCQKAFQRMAESLAKLHAKKSIQPFSILETDLAKFENKLSTVLESPFIFGEMEKCFSPFDFFKYVEQIKADALKVQLFYSYWHGDANLGNMLYDDLQDTFSFIDVAKLHYSISIEEEPLLDGTMDLVRVEENLRRKTLGLLSEHETETLLKSFYETYEQISGQKLVKQILLFDRTNKKLSRLVNYARYIQEEDPIKRSRDKAVFDSAIIYFKNQLE